ncbi:MAG: prepilin-type N-terminal cleavage/methylation domain-containing protein [Desulfobacterales bacterium]|jgi:prepilin-type N-terminal cleavage/methylation domain-containing protein
MIALKKISSRSKGFTLVEVIVTILAVGILGAIFINFMGTALTSSWNAVEITRDEANAEKVLEQIVGEYVVLINGNNPGNALTSIAGTYNGWTSPDGIAVATEFINFNTSGDEQTGGTDYLKVVLQASGQGGPAISGRYPLTTILANNRETDDDPQFLLY